MSLTTVEPSLFILTVDVGNTVTRLGLFVSDDLEKTWSLSTNSRITTDEAQLLLAQFFFEFDSTSFSRREHNTGALFSSSILSCVVPDITDIWIEVLRNEGMKPPLLVGPGLKTGIKMNYNDPSEVGSDRIADMVAAREHYRAPVVVIDFGTVTSLQVLDNTGVFVGGVLAPGLELASRSLAHAAARLPRIDLRFPPSVLGKTTREAMQSGILLGELARIDGLIDMIWQELGYETALVLSGSNTELLSPLLSHTTILDPLLTMKGLYLLHRMNRKG